MLKYLLIFWLILGNLSAQDSLTQSKPILPPTEIEDDDYFDPSAFSFDLSNPRNAAISHLFYLQAENLDESLSVKALYPGKYSQKQLTSLARKLKQIYDGSSYFVDVDAMPTQSDYQDSAQKSRYIVFSKYPEIYLKKYGDNWLYSRHSLEAIPRIHKEIFPYGADLLLKLVPSTGHFNLFGLQLWQWVGIFLLLVLAYLIYRVIEWMMAKVVEKLIPMVFNQNTLHVRQVHPVTKPLALLIVSRLLEQIAPALQLPLGMSKYINGGLKIISLFFAVMVAYKLVGLLTLLAKRMAHKTDTAMDDQLVPLVGKIAKTIVVILGIIFILQNLDINVTALLAGISIGGLALALAAKDTVQNFIGSISIFWDQPFQIGDFIETAEFSGTVLEVGVRTTRLVDIAGAIVSVPNGSLANMVITNSSLREYRRYNATLTVTYDTTVEQIENFVKAIEEIILAHPETRKADYVVRFHQMSDSSLDIYLLVYFELTAFDQFLNARQTLLSSIIKKAEELNVDFAFPSTSVYIEKN